MTAVALRKEISPVKTSPPHPAAVAVLPGDRGETGYRRAQAPAWLIDAIAWGCGIAACLAAWAAIAKFGGRIPDPLTVGAAAAVAQAGLGTGDEVVAMAVFVIIGTLGPGVPVAIYFAMGERAERLIDELKAWMGANNTPIMAVLCLVIGAKLLGDGISGLA